MDDDRREESNRRPPLQFSLRALLTLPVVVGLVFGTLRWLGVSPLASAIILVILTLSAAAAIGLLAALAGSDDDERITGSIDAQPVPDSGQESSLCFAATNTKCPSMNGYCVSGECGRAVCYRINRMRAKFGK